MERNQKILEKLKESKHLKINWGERDMENWKNREKGTKKK